MADVKVENIRSVLHRMFPRHGAGSDTWDTDFIQALNLAIRDINKKDDLETPISEVIGTESTITNLDQQYADTAIYQTAIHMAALGHRIPSKNLEALLKFYEARAVEALDDMWWDLVHDRQDADDEDDIIGLPDANDE